MGRTDDDDTVQLAVELTQLCRAFHVLPGPGGLLDQDPYHIRLLKAGLYGLTEKERIEAEKVRNSHGR